MNSSQENAPAQAGSRAAELDLRGQLAIAALEIAGVHRMHVARWIERGDWQRAVTAWRWSAKFDQLADQEMQAIGAALKDAENWSEAAIAYRAGRK